MASRLVDYVYKQADTRRTNNVLLMWGQDFAHRDGLSLDNLDKVLHYMSNYAL